MPSTSASRLNQARLFRAEFFEPVVAVARFELLREEVDPPLFTRARFSALVMNREENRRQIGREF